MREEIVEEILSWFGRTGEDKRPRIRKFHGELLYSKFKNQERVISKEELNRPKEYLDRFVKYSKGFLEYINEEAGEIKITDLFFEYMTKWESQYNIVEELNESDENLQEQGIIVTDSHITFDQRLLYSKFYKLVSDETESMNDPKNWLYSEDNLTKYDAIDMTQKESPLFSSKLCLLKVYVLRKIDEVSFVTSRFVHCPACNKSYIIPSMKIDFQQTYKCEQYVGDKQCGTTLKKFPARKMINTYIYEIAVNSKNREGFEHKEYFMESFIDLTPGYYTCMVFGRTEPKTNSYYFTCLSAKEEKSKIPFIINDYNSDHQFFNISKSIFQHIRNTGFVVDEEKAQLPVYIETIKRLILIVNKEINLDHSLYFGAPGIGKSFALKMLSNCFYSNLGEISGPRFSLPGLTGGQKEVLYQDTAKKKNVPGLFSMQAFIFDEINNDQFMADDKSVNLFKSVALSASGTSSTVGGKEFLRTALVAGTANYDPDYLRKYINTIKKIYSSTTKESNTGVKEQSNFVNTLGIEEVKEIPPDFDFFANIKDYSKEIPQELINSVLKVRDGDVNYLTNFPKPLMERFYWTVLVHPKYDKLYRKQKSIDVASHLRSRKSVFSQREMISQLFIPDLENQIKEMIAPTKARFDDPEVEERWSNQVKEFLNLMAQKYPEFFSMFSRIDQVHIYSLYTLSLINGEIELSFATKRIFEKLISLLHTPISVEEFHIPNFENFRFVGEEQGELLAIIKQFPDTDIRKFVDFDNRSIVRKVLIDLENNHQIKKIDDYHYEIDNTPRYESL